MCSEKNYLSQKLSQGKLSLSLSLWKEKCDNSFCNVLKKTQAINSEKKLEVCKIEDFSLRIPN